MEIYYKRRVFMDETIVRFEGDKLGIYIIQKNNEIVFIGDSVNLRKDILDYLSRMQGDRIKLSFYACNGRDFDPSDRAGELLQKYRESHGKMPELNDGSLIPDPVLLN